MADERIFPERTFIAYTRPTRERLTQELIKDLAAAGKPVPAFAYSITNAVPTNVAKVMGKLPSVVDVRMPMCLIWHSRSSSIGQRWVATPRWATRRSWVDTASLSKRSTPTVERLLLRVADLADGCSPPAVRRLTAPVSFRHTSTKTTRRFVARKAARAHSGYLTTWTGSCCPMFHRVAWLRYRR